MLVCPTPASLLNSATSTNFLMWQHKNDLKPKQLCLDPRGAPIIKQWLAQTPNTHYLDRILLDERPKTHLALQQGGERELQGSAQKSDDQPRAVDRKHHNKTGCNKHFSTLSSHHSFKTIHTVLFTCSHNSYSIIQNALCNQNISNTLESTSVFLPTKTTKKCCFFPTWIMLPYSMLQK